MPSSVLALLVLFLVPSVLCAPAIFNVAAFFSLNYNGAPDTAGVSRMTGWLAAIADINANSRYNALFTLNSTVFDTQRILARAAQQTQQALSEGSISLITVVTTPETQSIMNVSGTVPNVCAGANAAMFSNSTAFPYFIRDIPSGADQTTCMATIINSLGSGQKSATVYTYTDAATQPIAQALLSKITSTSLEVQSGIPPPNATNAANFLKSSGTSIWPIVCQSNDISVIAGALNAAGVVQGQYIIPSVDSALTSALFSANGSSTVAQNLFGCTLATANTTEYQAFVTSYYKIAPSTNALNITMDSKAPYTYDLAYIVAEAALAVLNAGGNVADNAVLMAAIRKVNFTGASGQIFFNAGSNDIGQSKNYVVKKVSGTNFNQVGTYANGAFTRTDPTFVFPSAPSSTSSTGATGNTTSSTTSTSTTGGTTSSSSSLFVSFSALFLAALALFL